MAEPNPWFVATDSTGMDPKCGDQHRTFAGAAACAVRNGDRRVREFSRVNGKVVLGPIWCIDAPPAGVHQMEILKLHRGEYVAFFLPNDHFGARQFALLHPEYFGEDWNYLHIWMAPLWTFEFRQLYTVEEAKRFNHVPYLNIDGTDGEEPGLYVDGVRVE